VYLATERSRSKFTYSFSAEPDSEDIRNLTVLNRGGSPLRDITVSNETIKGEKCYRYYLCASQLKSVPIYFLEPARKKRKPSQVDSERKPNTSLSSSKANKQLKGDGKPLRGSRGKLMNFFAMPIDIFVEVCLTHIDRMLQVTRNSLQIASHLCPIDLLHLARTSKFLRAVLMSRITSNHIWKASRANIDGLPACPSDLSEPQYARLVFDNSCYVITLYLECATTLLMLGPLPFVSLV
jgi:hypothetical protein